MTLLDLAGWLPISVYWQQDQPVVDWCYFGERRPTEPFFDHTIDVLLRHPFNVLFRHQTPLDALGALYARDPGLPPSGFIFHMSRCGSTLIAQMLAALPQHIVISEAAPIDSVLQAHLHASAITDDQRIAWLRWVVGTFGRKRSGRERHLIIKLDCWHTGDLPLIRRAFPNVPWIFVYRYPVEVLVSHERMPGIQMVPGLLDPRIFDLDPATIATMPQQEYRARVLGRICQSAVEHARNPGGLLVPYRKLPGAVTESLLRHFGIDCAPDEIEQMRQAAQFNAKRPQMPFAQDSRDKQQAASDEIRALVDRWIRPAYEQLEALTQEQSG